jgi:hypothetical protein
MEVDLMRHLTMNQKTKFSDQVDFRTPAYLFQYIKSLYNKVDFDGACFADGSNALANPLRLENEWPEGVVYSNPPFDDNSIIKWIKKGYNYTRKNNNNIHIMIIPNKLNHVKIQKEALELIDKIIFLGGRVNFSSKFAVKGGASRNGSVILIQDYKISKNKNFEYVLLSELKAKYSGV